MNLQVHLSRFHKHADESEKKKGGSGRRRTSCPGPRHENKCREIRDGKTRQITGTLWPEPSKRGSSSLRLKSEEKEQGERTKTTRTSQGTLRRRCQCKRRRRRRSAENSHVLGHVRSARRNPSKNVPIRSMCYWLRTYDLWHRVGTTGAVEVP